MFWMDWMVGWECISHSWERLISNLTPRTNQSLTLRSVSCKGRVWICCWNSYPWEVACQVLVRSTASAEEVASSPFPTSSTDQAWLWAANHPMTPPRCYGNCWASPGSCPSPNSPQVVENHPQGLYAVLSTLNPRPPRPLPPPKGRNLTLNLCPPIKVCGLGSCLHRALTLA